jgi:hypothetical protein
MEVQRWPSYYSSNERDVLLAIRYGVTGSIVSRDQGLPGIQRVDKHYRISIIPRATDQGIHQTFISVLGKKG